ncbi:hypothetical protein QTI66_17415 [Variovorax sp. J22R133]|uniref:hypothetical protein n=1 Tax=Variovorax brevis TaxID=3053503 RepID=UPI0025774BE7|nr:hypothetical protein [Variovorax sp. J22R133]MDM0113937.1 hypothetical protein [Variovorax sp. J22R133]
MYDADLTAIERYNARVSEKYRLHPEMGPCPHEGNIDTAPVVLLLANPGFDATSTLDDHHFKIDGWPLAGLHESAPVGMSGWWRPRLRSLSQRYGEQFISHNVAALQINPWASAKYDENLRLPSRAAMLGLAEAAAKRGAALIMIRASKAWLESDVLCQYEHIYRTNSALSSYVSEGNLSPEAWAYINDKLAAVSL